MIAFVPCIIDYDDVQRSREADGFRSLYYNSGAFGFSPDVERSVKTIAWIGPEDPTIRPAAHAFVRRVAPPHPQTLARLAAEIWEKHLPGPAWVMPMSHWSFELEHGHRSFMPALLRQIKIDPDALSARNTGDAIEFALAERGMFEMLTGNLLENLKASDFAIAFPGRTVLCMLHHHQQLWWQTPTDALHAALEAVVASASSRPI